MKTALILGVSGQDGAYLAQLLLTKGYVVHGTSRRSADRNVCATHQLLGIHGRVTIHTLPERDGATLREILIALKPDEIYNLAGLSSVAQSFNEPDVARASIVGAQSMLLESVAELLPRARVYHSASSECFGNLEPGSAASEATPFAPRSPYAEAKAAAHHATIECREKRGLFACSGIVFNHESPLRGEMFVTKKIVSAAAAIAAGKSREPLHLGDLSASRDWGYAPEYVDAMWRMLQQDEPRDFVIATGESHTVAELAEAAFAELGLDSREHVTTDESLRRPSELSYSRGDASLAREVLGWEAKTKFGELVRLLAMSFRA